MGLEISRKVRRACDIIGKADNIRNLELLLVPMRYSDGVLTNLGWIEVWLLFSAFQ